MAKFTITGDTHGTLDIDKVVRFFDDHEDDTGSVVHQFSGRRQTGSVLFLVQALSCGFHGQLPAAFASGAWRDLCPEPIGGERCFHILNQRHRISL